MASSIVVSPYALLDGRTITSPPGAPGTAPLIAIRPRSASTRTTSRRCVLWRPVRVVLGNDNLVDQVLAEFAAEHGFGNRQLLFAISDGKFHLRLSLCLARRTDDHVAARCARHGALDRDQAALGVDPDHFEALRALAHGTHVAGHLLARENATGRLPLADRARRAMRQRVAVRRVAHLEVPALDRDLETLALA